MIVSDDGSELTSTAVVSRAGEANIQWQDIAPGKPTQSAYVESLNGRMRDELLNATLFMSPAMRVRRSPEVRTITTPSGRTPRLPQDAGSVPCSIKTGLCGAGGRDQ